MIATLGERWTTRIIVVAGSAARARGPYRFLNHPNYLIVTAGDCSPAVGVRTVANCRCSSACSTPPFWPSASARRTSALAQLAQLRCSRLYRPPLLDIVRCLRLGPRGPVRELFGFAKGLHVTDMAALNAADRARGRRPRLSARARGDDRRHVRPDAAGDGRAARHASARRSTIARRSRGGCPRCSTPGSRRPRPDRGRLPARGQLAGHRPAADPPRRLCRLGRATRRASTLAEPLDGAKQVSRHICRASSDDTVRLAGQGRAATIPSRSHPSLRPSCC